MADLVRYLRDTGGIVAGEGHVDVARGVPDVPRDLPESVRGMIARKIEQVDEEDRRLLLAASVQGSEFDSAIVGEAAKMDPGEVEDRLEELERVHVFVSRGDEQEFPDGTLTLKYRFVHVLYQNVLLRVAAADAPGDARQGDRRGADGALRQGRAVDRAAPRGAVRDRAGFRRERAVLLHRRAARGRAVRVPRSALARRARARRAGDPARKGPSGCSWNSASR